MTLPASHGLLFEDTVAERWRKQKCADSQKQFRERRKAGIAKKPKSAAWWAAVRSTPDRAWSVEWKRYAAECGRKRSGLLFGLSRADFQRIAEGSCSYCGAEPSIPTHTGGLKRSTIDRVDPSRGYVLNNCVPACWPCNRMKWQFSAAEFVSLAKRIATFRRDA